MGVLRCLRTTGEGRDAASGMEALQGTGQVIRAEAWGPHRWEQSHDGCREGGLGVVPCT